MATTRKPHGGKIEFKEALFEPPMAIVSSQGKQTIDDDQPTLSGETSEETIPTDGNEDDSDYPVGRKRFKRHVGPHDSGGLQRTISTGRGPSSSSLVIYLFDPQAHSRLPSS